MGTGNTCQIRLTCVPIRPQLVAGLKVWGPETHFEAQTSQMRICSSGVPTGDGELAKSKYAWPAAICSRYSGLWPILELKLQLFLKYSTKTFIINYKNNDKLI